MKNSDKNHLILKEKYKEKKEEYKFCPEINNKYIKNNIKVEDRLINYCNILT